jgi:hypothetical protein
MRNSFAMLAAVILPTVVFSQENHSVINWESLGSAWNAYIEKPNDQTAQRVYNVLPATIPDSIPTSEIGSRLDESIYRNLDKLESQIKLKKRSALRLAFRLMAISDGDFTESLNAILGSFIRTDPRLFLQELQSHHSLVRGLEGLLNSGGDDSTDSESGWKKEHQQRIKAFQTVKDKNLVGVRDECIAVLHTQVNE